MRSGSYWILAIAITGIFVCRGLSAQTQRPAEFLIVPNQTSTPITVYLKAHAQDGRIIDWREVAKVEAGKDGEIQLGAGGAGYQPFDIAIREADGTYTVMYAIKLCDWMSQCRGNNKQDWDIPTQVGRWTKDGQGRDVFKDDPQVQRILRATPDAYKVTIPWHLVGQKPNDPIIRP